MTDPYYADALVTLYHGDCREIMAELPDASVDAVVTDPPYGLEFMGTRPAFIRTQAYGDHWVYLDDDGCVAFSDKVAPLDPWPWQEWAA